VTTVLASAAVLAGAAFMFVAALGVARLPDLYTRMQAATKATTVGVVGVMCGVAVAHHEVSVTIRAVLIAGFLLLTSPVAAHAIARSAHTRQVPLAPGTRIELGDRAREDAFAPIARDLGPPRLTERADAGERTAAPDAERDEMRS
jgi:multicomponent Na+:H+ antiporter subunit G